MDLQNQRVEIGMPIGVLIGISSHHSSTSIYNPAAITDLLLLLSRLLLSPSFPSNAVIFILIKPS